MNYDRHSKAYRSDPESDRDDFERDRIITKLVKLFDNPGLDKSESDAIMRQITLLHAGGNPKSKAVAHLLASNGQRQPRSRNSRRRMN